MKQGIYCVIGQLGIGYELYGSGKTPGDETDGVGYAVNRVK